MTTVRIPSGKTLRTRFFTEAACLAPVRRLRKAMRAAMYFPGGSADVGEALETANTLVEGFGVEAIRAANVWDRYYMDIACLYVNRGDTYDETLIYDVPRGIFLVQSYGDWVERAERRGVQVI